MTPVPLLHSKLWRQPAQHENKQQASTRGRSTLSALGFRLRCYCSDYPLIYSQSKDFLMRKFEAIQYQSKPDYWSNPDYPQLMDFTTEDTQLLKGRAQRHSNTAP